jgi:hypothetical protein
MIIDTLVFSKHLEKGEKVLYAIHKHWITISAETLGVAFFGFLIPWSFYLIGFNTIVFFWIAVAWSVFAYLRFLYVLIDMYANVWLVTDMGIIVIGWRGFFSNTSTRISYEDIEGVAYEIKGFWSTILRYGDITLKVMSGNNMGLKSVSHPQKAELAIMRLQDKFMGEKEMQDAGNLKNILAEMVSHHLRNK